MVPIEAMAKFTMCNMDSRTKKNRAKVWRKITLSYVQSQDESMLRCMRVFGKAKEGETKYQDCYGQVNCIILSIREATWRVKCGQISERLSQLTVHSTSYLKRN